MAADQKKDEIMKKFSKNLRKLLENRDPSPQTQKKGPVHSQRGVRFNPETVDVSFGGTEYLGKIKDPTLDETKISIDINLSADKHAASTTKHTVNSVNGKGNKRDKVFKAPPPVKVARTSSSENIEGPKSPRRRSESEAKKPVHNHPGSSNGLTSVSKSVTVQHNTPVRRHTMDLLKQSTNGVGTPECFKPVSFETPISTPRLRPKRSSGDDDGQVSEDSSVTVAVRVRPFSAREIAEGENKSCVSMIDNQTIVTSEKNEVHRFTYDYSFWSTNKTGGEFASQLFLYEALAQPMLCKAFEGFNTCLFAYGQTGSGKSYSIMGHGEDSGVIPRFCEELFSRIDNNIEKSVLNVEISYFEIYNEKIHDLLGPYTKDKTGKKPNLKVREHPVLGPYVEGLSSYVTKSFDDVKGWLSVGNKHRATAATGMNDKSSRSHSVFTMVLTQTRTDNIEGEEHEHSITSKINLVDLAGSERQSVAKTSGDRLREGASINKSLMTLGKVISLLAEQSSSDGTKKKKCFIPYRDSVLTWLLKESLGGNSKTAMLATISPAQVHMEETLSTLRYANTARSIVNMARVNEDPKARLIRELRMEIDKLRTATGVVSEDVISSSLAEITSLREKLLEKEKEMAEMTKSWQERLMKSEERKLEEARKLEKSGIALQIDNKMPNLVNLNEDPQLSEMLLYVLREGDSQVGRMKENSSHEIQLNGPLIADNHCIFKNDGKKVVISPIGDAPTYVNGDLITESAQLHHGDRVILGGDHYFRFNHPIEVQQGRKSGSFTSGGLVQPKDFEFARQELVRVQNARLEAELEEARLKHEEQLKEELERKEEEARIKMEIELQKMKQKAEMELSMQRHEYDDKLAELQQNLSVHRAKSQNSDSHIKQAESLVKKLEQQKSMLEQEVLANRKRLEMEAKASQMVVEESRQNHCKIVEQLEREKQKIAKDVEQLRIKRKGLGSTPRPSPLPAGKTPIEREKKDLYRIALLLREANKIAQYLKKDTMFSREDLVNGDSTQTFIKVTNTKLSVSTYWSMGKFEGRLLQMRELYQSEADSCPGEADELFYDPSDNWEKDDKLGTSPGLSPKMLKSLRRQQISPSPMAVKLSFDSEKATSPKSRDRSSGDSSVMERGFLANLSPTSEMPVFEENQPQAPDHGPPLVSLCRELITGALNRFKGESMRESVADRVLHSCEIVQSAVTSMLDSYNNYTEDSNSKGGDASSTLEGEVMRVRSVQLATCIELMLSHCSLWSAMYETISSSLVKDLCEAIMAAVKKLANQVVFFLQGCENDIDSMVQESSSQIYESLFQLCRHCGELALATETPMAALKDIIEETLSEEEKYSNIKLGDDVRQHFLSGCDRFIDKTVQGSVRTVEECQVQVKALEADFKPSNAISMTDELLKQIEMTTNTTKVLLETLQQAQAELETTIMDDTPENKCDNYYHRNYLRSQQLISHIGNLADSVSLLVQATEPLVRGKEDGSVRRLVRCAEMIEKTTVKIIAASNLERGPSNVGGSADPLTDDVLEQSVLTDSQTETLDSAAADVENTTRALKALLKKSQGPDTPGTPSKSKRTIPASPSSAKSGVGGMPWHSSKQNKNMKQNLDLVDVAEVGR